MACLILKTLILIGIRLVGALGWMRGRPIGVLIVKRGFRYRKSEIKTTPCNQTFYIQSRW
jgi:hypothetical protein